MEYILLLTYQKVNDRIDEIMSVKNIESFPKTGTDNQAKIPLHTVSHQHYTLFRQFSLIKGIKKKASSYGSCEHNMATLPQSLKHLYNTATYEKQLFEQNISITGPKYRLKSSNRSNIVLCERLGLCNRIISPCNMLKNWQRWKCVKSIWEHFLSLIEKDEGHE